MPVSWGSTPDDQFEQLDKYPAVFGEFVWTGFDYLGEPTPYQRDVTGLLNFTDPELKAALAKQLEEVGKIKPPSRSSYFGIVDLCGFPKDRFYLYQARWRNDLSMAHILPHWNWPERVGKITPVHVYTSGDEAELFLNGKSLGKKKFGEYQYRLRWDDVIYEPGELKVVAYKNGKAWAQDVMKTAGDAFDIDMRADRNQINADGLDLSFITVKVVDKDGVLVPRSDNLINFEVEGPGRIVAVGNGNAASHEPFQANYRKVFNGLCLVVVESLENKPGTVKITASSEGLNSRSILIATNPCK
jgi:beta-galactosidase